MTEERREYLKQYVKKRRTTKEGNVRAEVSRQVYEAVKYGLIKKPSRCQATNMKPARLLAYVTDATVNMLIRRKEKAGSFSLIDFKNKIKWVSPKWLATKKKERVYKK